MKNHQKKEKNDVLFIKNIITEILNYAKLLPIEIF